MENWIIGEASLPEMPKKIVLCRYCKWRPVDKDGSGWGYKLEFPKEGICPFQCDDPWYSRMPDDDFYCANGKI